jgi:Protein of unknown function (DUF669).
MNPLFSPSSGTGNSFELIPGGTLAWVDINVREIKRSQNGGQYIDTELTIPDGPFQGRKIFAKIMDPLFEENSTAARQMGVVALTRILEACGQFNPAEPDSYNQFEGGGIQALALAIDQQRAAIKIKVSKGQNGYEDKNDVGEWLTPNPAATRGFKFWKNLQDGKTTPGASKSFAPPSTSTPFQHAAGAQKPANATPSWLQGPKPTGQPPVQPGAPVAQTQPTPTPGTQPQQAPEPADDAGDEEESTGGNPF